MLLTMKRTSLIAALCLAACGGPSGPYVVGISGSYGTGFACNGRIAEDDRGEYQAAFACRELTQVGVAWPVIGPARVYHNKDYPDLLQLHVWRPGRDEVGQPDLAISIEPDGTGNATLILPRSDGWGVPDCAVTWHRE